MQVFQIRVEREKNELDSKLSNLYAFLHGSIFPTLEADEQLRLVRQARVMEEYSKILAERIANFKEN